MRSRGIDLNRLPIVLLLIMPPSCSAEPPVRTWATRSAAAAVISACVARAMGGIMERRSPV